MATQCPVLPLTTNFSQNDTEPSKGISYPVADLCRHFTKLTGPCAYTLHSNPIPPKNGLLVTNVSQHVFVILLWGILMYPLTTRKSLRMLVTFKYRQKIDCCGRDNMSLLPDKWQIDILCLLIPKIATLLTGNKLSPFTFIYFCCLVDRPDS